MIRFITIFLLVAVSLFAKEDVKNRFYLYANFSENQVELKWFTTNYSDKYTYEVYRIQQGGQPTLMQRVKPVEYTVLKANGYSEDYIFMIYPLKNAKTISDKIQIAKIDENVQGFRMLKFMRDSSFAKNLGQYYQDISVNKDKLYAYVVKVFEGKKQVFENKVLAHTFKQGIQDDFMWTNAKVLAEGVALNWDIKDDYNYYNVYRKKEGEKEFIKINQDLLFVTKEYAQKAKYLYLDVSLNPQESASYYIRRVDIFAQEGTPSKEFKVTRTVKSLKPKRIENVFVINKDTKIQLRWEKGYDILGYNIYRSTIYEGNFQKINSDLVKDEVFFDKSIQVKTNYFYYITAVNKNGESKPSNTVLAYARDTMKPQRPENLKAKVLAGKADFSWDKVEDKDLLGYRIYMSMDKDASQWSLVNQEVIKTNSFELKQSKTLSRFPYFYKVTAVDGSFNESFASAIIEVKFPDVTPPKQPFIQSYNSYANQIVLEWNEIQGYDVAGYNVYRVQKDKLLKLNSAILTQRIFTDKQPVQAENKYTITAVDQSGNESEKKEITTVVLKDLQPVKIEDFKLQKREKGIEASFTCKDKDYSGFQLLRSSGEILNYVSVSDFQKTKSFIDTKISQKTKYFYMIKAYDVAGNISESRVLEMQN